MLEKNAEFLPANSSDYSINKLGGGKSRMKSYGGNADAAAQATAQLAASNAAASNAAAVRNASSIGSSNAAVDYRTSKLYGGGIRKLIKRSKPTMSGTGKNRSKNMGGSLRNKNKSSKSPKSKKSNKTQKTKGSFKLFGKNF